RGPAASEVRPARHAKRHGSKGVVMHWSLKRASSVLLGFALLTVGVPDAHAGRPGGGHGGHRGHRHPPRPTPPPREPAPPRPPHPPPRPPAPRPPSPPPGTPAPATPPPPPRGCSPPRPGGRRFNRWMYFDPACNRWCVPSGTDWVLVPVDDAP